MKLIVNADDFGYSKGVNLGIVEAYREGIVTSATTMVNMGGLAHAVDLAKVHPGLGVGIHLVLTCGTPILPDVPSLVDPYGDFHKQGEIFQTATAADIEREFVSQIERFYATGLIPTHLDSHHHVHGHELVSPIVLRLAERYGLPLRRISRDPGQASVYRSVKTTDRFCGDFYGDRVSYETIKQMLHQGEEVESVEMMCHPAYLDEALLSGSSYALPRAKELAVLTDNRIKQAVLQANVELITYKEIV